MNKVTLLLILTAANLVAAILLWTLPSGKPVKIRSTADIEGVVFALFRDHGLPKETTRTRTLEFENGAKRTIYSAHVPPAWPKTRFHIDLADTLGELGLRTYGVVEFPDRHLRIHILHKGKVVRTVALVTDRTVL